MYLGLYNGPYVNWPVVTNPCFSSSKIVTTGERDLVICIVAILGAHLPKLIYIPYVHILYITIDSVDNVWK